MNNETQHTPGPWFLVKETMKPFAEGSVRFYIDDQNGFRIYDPVSEGLKGRTRQEAEANAKLIASAPSLLKENQELKEQNSALSQLNGLYFDENNSIKSINEELIKALEKIQVAAELAIHGGANDLHRFCQMVMMNTRPLLIKAKPQTTPS
jgi:hypothetical protein